MPLICFHDIMAPGFLAAYQKVCICYISISLPPSPHSPHRVVQVCIECSSSVHIVGDVFDGLHLILRWFCECSVSQCHWLVYHTLCCSCCTYNIIFYSEGSGIPEMKTVLRGINLTGYLSIRTFISKSVRNTQQKYILILLCT